MSLRARFDDWYFAPAPAVRLATLRLLVGAFALLYLVLRAPVLIDFSLLDARRFEPVGVIHVLSGPLPGWLVVALWACAIASAVAFTLGLRFDTSGPLFALLMLWVMSYRNSWGMIFHSDNLLVVHALCLGYAPAADALSLDAGARPEPTDDARYGWPLRLMCALTVATYFLAGVAKLRGAGLDWAMGDVLRNHIAYDAMRKLELGSVISPFGAWLVQFESPFPIFSMLTLALELGAPLALLGPRVALVIAAGLWSFHFGILLAMAIVFAYPLSGVGLAPLLPAERVLRWPGFVHVAAWLRAREGTALQARSSHELA